MCFFDFTVVVVVRMKLFHETECSRNLSRESAHNSHQMSRNKNKLTRFFFAGKYFKWPSK